MIRKTEILLKRSLRPLIRFRDQKDPNRITLLYRLGRFAVAGRALPPSLFFLCLYHSVDFSLIYQRSCQTTRFRSPDPGHRRRMLLTVVCWSCGEAR
uniref:Uncharacterized protein n=1 Tax=Brassica oleracea TaxID=3712 RepID=A0A3P6E4S3_BRAOL|nr:unnamed protein product [Brassica oleracea]